MTINLPASAANAGKAAHDTDVFVPSQPLIVGRHPTIVKHGTLVDQNALTKMGTPISRLANGTLTVFDLTSSDGGEEDPIGVLAFDAPDVGGVQTVAVWCDGDFNFAAMQGLGSTTALQLQTAFERKAPGVVIRTVASLTPDEPEGDSGVAE